MSFAPVGDLVTPWARHLKPYPPGKPVEEVERELGHPAIKLASNENPLGPSPLAIEAVRRCVTRAHFYPDGDGYYLRERLAELHDVDMNQVILGAGSTDLIELIAKTCLVPGDEMVMSRSSFYVYETAALSVGATLAKATMRGYACDLEAIARAVTERTKLIYLANPNNPTGTMFTADELDVLLDSLPRRVLVVLDEAYYDYVDRPGYSRSINAVRSGAPVIVLRTFSKVHGLAGLRIGYGIADPELIDVLNRVRSPFNASSVAQTAALASLDDHDHLKMSVEVNRREMAFLEMELNALGVAYTPSVANFILMHTELDGDDLFRRLLHEGVIVRPMKLYEFPKSLRVTVGTHADNEMFLAALVSVGATPRRSAELTGALRR